SLMKSAGFGRCSIVSKETTVPRKRPEVGSLPPNRRGNRDHIGRRHGRPFRERYPYQLRFVLESQEPQCRSLLRKRYPERSGHVLIRVRIGNGKCVPRTNALQHVQERAVHLYIRAPCRLSIPHI